MWARNWTNEALRGLLLAGRGRAPRSCPDTPTTNGQGLGGANQFGAWISVRLSGLLLALEILAVSAQPSVAHANLQRATPSEGSTVHRGPAEVALQFTQRLEPALSSASVLGENGENVAAIKPTINNADRRILQVPLKAGLSGKYRVIWRVLSVDSHISKGEFTFTVAP